MAGTANQKTGSGRVFFTHFYLACRGQVRFAYQNGRTKKRELRARNFGFLHPNRKRTVALLQLVLKFNPSRLLPHLKARPAMLCQCCGAPMQFMQTMIKPWLPKRPNIKAHDVPIPLAA